MSGDGVMGKIVVYDLVSENNVRLVSRELRDKVRTVRVLCTEKLHSLGVMCTESVILVSPSCENEIEDAINYVNRKYEELFRELEAYGVSIEWRPIIRVLDTTVEQFEAFRELAERQIVSRIDETVERINQILESLVEITETAQRRRIRARLLDLRREWRRLREATTQLQLRSASDVEYVLELIDQALSRLEE